MSDLINLAKYALLKKDLQSINRQQSASIISVSSTNSLTYDKELPIETLTEDQRKEAKENGLRERERAFLVIQARKHKIAASLATKAISAVQEAKSPLSSRTSFPKRSALLSDERKQSNAEKINDIIASTENTALYAKERAIEIMKLPSEGKEFLLEFKGKNKWEKKPINIIDSILGRR